MTGRPSIRGEVNAILNDLIRDDVIKSFETNFDDPISCAFALHVRVVADIGLGLGARGYDERRRKIQESVMRKLNPLAPEVIVSVRARKQAHGRRLRATVGTV